MERFNPELALTSTEIADLLGVHPSTVKRWCNDGELPFGKTDGGHRRIHLEDATAFARQKGIENVLTPFHPYEPHVWSALSQVRQKGSFARFRELAMGWLVRGRLRPLGSLFEALARDPAVTMCAFCDQGVREFMVDVGEAWSAGTLRVAEEHSVSQLLAEVLMRVRMDGHDPGDRPRVSARVAVVGALEGNQHHLGTLCVRLLLERLGWDVVYLGPDVPVEDFGAMQRARRAVLVCVALTPPPAAGDLVRAVRILRADYDETSPYALAFGGFAPLEIAEDSKSGPFTNLDMFTTCGAFKTALEGGFALPAGGPRGD